MIEDPELDAPRLLRTLADGGVDFVVIGGLALVLQGSPRVTYDLDICFAPDPANLAALGTVLTGLHARLRGIDEAVPFVPDAGSLRRIEILTLDTDAGSLDLLRRPDGAPRYDVLRRNANRYDVGGFEVRVASVEDLILMKSAADRDKDRADLTELQAILRLRGESEP